MALNKAFLKLYRHQNLENLFEYPYTGSSRGYSFSNSYKEPLIPDEVEPLLASPGNKIHGTIIQTLDSRAWIWFPEIALGEIAEKSVMRVK